MIPEDRLLTDEDKIHKLWCQHCKALQKVNRTIVNCWYRPLAQNGREKAYCAASIDAISEIMKIIHAKTRRETAREIFEEIEKEFFAEPQYISEHGKEPVLGCLDEITWQALKAQYEGVNK